MVFVETPIFTAAVQTLLTDELCCSTAASSGSTHCRRRHRRYRRLAEDPIRWTTMGHGKRGGTRVIYYHVVVLAQIRMILIYRKGIKDDLTPREKTVLRKINAEW